MTEEILFRASVEYDNEWECSNASLFYEVITIEQLLDKMSEHQLQSHGLIRIKTNNKEKLSKDTVEQLKLYGWTHLKTAEDRYERKILQEEYYLINPVKSVWNYRSDVEKINPESLDSDQIERLGSGHQIVQQVAPKSVLAPSEYKKLQTKRKQIAAAAEKKRLSKEKREAKKREKEIEKAKQILKESGEIQ